MKKVWMAVAATALLCLPAIAAKGDKQAGPAKAKAPVMGTISDISATALTVMHTAKGKAAAGQPPEAAEFTLNDKTLYASLAMGAVADVKAQTFAAVVVDANPDKPTAQGLVVWTGKEDEATLALDAASRPLTARLAGKAAKGAKNLPKPTVLVGQVTAVTADSLTLKTAEKDVTIALAEPVTVLVASSLKHDDLAKQDTVEVTQAVGGKGRQHLASVVLRLPARAARAGGGKGKK
ncbi:MAG: hypothetical protein HZB16_05090 [Armatimonadetes bacterium]|nr:hypothetical protein [Armatimonadota bacterium]